jgi:16S rRNA processing protein RimM
VGRGATVVIGRIAGAHGVEGEVGVRPTGPTLATLSPGTPLVARLAGAEEVALVLARRRGSDERPILAFQDISDRESAAVLAGAELTTSVDRLPELEPDTHYVRDLVGCEVLAGDESLGRVVDVLTAPANDALEVDGPRGRLLLPFTADAIREVDVPSRRLVVRPDLVPDP